MNAIPQDWTETREGHEERRSGTLLLFSIGDEPFGFRPMMRVRPVLTWTDANGDQKATTEDINVGNMLSTVLWTIATVLIAGLLIAGLAWGGRKTRDNPLLLLTAFDGHLSLAQTQIAHWRVGTQSTTC